MSVWVVTARSVSEEFSSGCEGRSGSGGGSTGAPADQDHRPDHKQHRDRTPDDRDEGNPYGYPPLLFLCLYLVNHDLRSDSRTSTKLHLQG